ncbi:MULTISPECIES: DUF485 domain-containing protein [unclassified Exiguobacterium]|uniref:DUF485 domain-containing protein n=1 Tax=unclassified Exiguobacterium TaxID=2644629 RepID=UPI001BE967A6|nr:MULTISPECIES: DUF485 domain-containing protein [unclassified Exiguobacterium]
MHDVTHVTRTDSTRAPETIVESSSFHKLMQEKNRFIVPSIIFSLIFYFTLPISTSYFTFLNIAVACEITWAWVLAFAQFFMTWTFCVMYSRRARRFDELIAAIKQEEDGR